MIFTPRLHSARLLSRYKRFLADVRLADGSIVTVHCPNTGSMKHCLVPDSECWLSLSANGKRKYPYTLEVVTTTSGHRAWIHSQKANALVAEALARAGIAELSGYDAVQTEVAYGDKSRIDFLLTNQESRCFVEVKSVTLLDPDLPLDDSELAHSLCVGCFPDAVSERAHKHLRDLMNIVASGHRAVLLFCVMHEGIQAVSPAGHIDPEYAQLLREAIKSGVEVIAYRIQLSELAIELAESIPVVGL